jgi:sigma-B regulation protein RsbQ
MVGEVERLSIRESEYAVFTYGHGAYDIVLLHGFQNDHTVWQPLIDRLDPQHYRIVVPDLLGCGSSSGPTSWERCTIEEYAADVLALCQAFELDHPAIIGHSLGGAITLSAGLTEPGRFSAAVLIAPASTSGLDFLPDEQSFNDLAHPSVEAQRALARAAFRHPPPAADLEQLMRAISQAMPQHIEGAARSMRTFEVQEDLAQFAIPAIVICGDRDRHVPLGHHLATQHAIARCSLQVYFDCGHVPFVEYPDACAADVARFLGLTESPGAS